MWQRDPVAAFQPGVVEEGAHLPRLGLLRNHQAYQHEQDGRAQGCGISGYVTPLGIKGDARHCPPQPAPRPRSKGSARKRSIWPGLCLPRRSSILRHWPDRPDSLESHGVAHIEDAQLLRDLSLTYGLTHFIDFCAKVALPLATERDFERGAHALDIGCFNREGLAPCRYCGSKRVGRADQAVNSGNARPWQTPSHSWKRRTSLSIS